MDLQRHARPHRGRRGVAALLTGLAATGLLLLTGTAPASAHDALVAATPADGGAVPTAPAAVTLQFSGVVQELGAEVVVTGPDGAAVGRGEPQVVDATLTQPLAPGLPAGTYSVAWRVTSADGHPVSGSTAFTVTGGTTGPVQEASAARPAGSSSSGAWIAVGAGAVLLVALLVAARSLRRRA
ncbi:MULTISPECIES: copper resistance CopC family protein [unclassified Blastococcus]